MKKSMLVLTAALMFGGLATAQTAATASAPQVPALTDVPAGHWAKDAIDRLVSRGIILGYPDGTFRGTQNLTRYEAAVIIARLLEQMAAGQVPAPQGEDLTALQNAVQELAADLAALGVRVSDLEENAVSKDDFSRLEARVEELALAGGEANAVADIQAQIADLTARADEYDTLRADVDDNASSIAALNDLTVLLNQDILDLQDRVSAVEAAQADFVTRADFDNLSGKVTAIDTRVGVLEKAPKFSVSGTVSASYGRLALTSTTRTAGVNSSGTTVYLDPNFDVDRLTRQTFADNVFSGGKIICPSGTWNTTGNPVGCTDTDRTPYQNDSYLIFGVNASNLATADGKFVVNNASVNFYANSPLRGADGVTANIDNVSMNGTLNGQKFDVRYEPYRSKFKFQDYLFANDNYTVGTDTGNGHRGIVANIQADQLPLKPKLTVVTGYATPFVDVDNTLNGAYYGLRASVNPANIGTFGVSFAQMDGPGFTSGAGTVATRTLGGSRSAVGVDFDLGFGVKNASGNSPFTLKGEYVGSIPSAASTFITGGGTVQNAISSLQSAGYVEGKADLGIVKFGANYRAIHPAYANGVASMSTNYASYYPGVVLNGYPYDVNQVGFGAAAAANIGPVALGAYYDSNTEWLAGTDRYTFFGASAGVKFFGLGLLGFYNSASLAGEKFSVDTDAYYGPTNYSNGCGGWCYNLSDVYMDIADVPFNYSSNFGARLRHDGKAADALVKNLNFTAAYIRFNGEGQEANDIQVYGDYSGTLAGITLAPFARYHNFSGSDDVSAYTTVKYGVKASTQPLTSVPLQPSLFGNFVQRNTDIANSNNDIGETLAQAGLTLNQAFVPNLKASLGYAYYAGRNVGSMATASSASAGTATYNAAADRIYRTPLGASQNPFTGANAGVQSGNLNGVFAQMDWNGLQANYGIFKYNVSDRTTGAATSSVAQGFKVSYTFKF